MYRLPESAKKVVDLYDSFDWNQVVQMNLEEVNLTSNEIQLHNKKVISFGNASYLGFHKDQRVIEAGVKAIRDKGILYCSTRSYTIMPEHDEFEDLLSNIFGRPTIATVQTAMANFGAMPLLMLNTDVVLVDTMAHATLQNMLLIPKASGTTVDRVMHNNLSHLESKIQFYRNKSVEKIWYVCDSVYSMYGDVAPINDLLYLMDKYDNFYIYIDDAHGMSWTGPNGAGFVWKHLPLGHDKVVMATSLGKGFGIGGGALICPNPEIKSWMRRAGLNLVFCTQLNNQTLASGIEVAKIHLSNEIYVLQDKLKENIDFFIETAMQLQLSFYDFSNTPLFYLIVGKHENAIKLNIRLRESGFYANLGTYPAVPMKSTGLRISITADHNKDEIKNLLNKVAEILNEIYLEDDTTLQEVYALVSEHKSKIA